MIARTLLATAAASMATIVSAEASGAYATLALPTPEDCAQACEGDSLCMAWRFEADACGLRATAPKTMFGGASGLSSRALAAGFSSATKRPASEPTPDNAPPAELVHDVRPVQTALTADDALLGGPEPIDLALNGAAPK